MKRLIKLDSIFGMADLNPQKAGLSVTIWSEHGGILRNVSHSNTPRVKIGYQGGPSVSVTISENPEIKVRSNHIKKSEMKAIEEGIAYVSRNYDIFLKHFMDTKYEFDDDDMKDALRKRGEYK